MIDFRMPTRRTGQSEYHVKDIEARLGVMKEFTIQLTMGYLL